MGRFDECKNRLREISIQGLFIRRRTVKDQTQASEEFGYILWVPTETPDGQTVTVQAGERDGRRMMHAETADQSTFYFEILAYDALLDHDELVSGQKGFLAENSEDGTTTEPIKEMLYHLKGTSFEFRGTLQNRWKERKFFIVDGASRTYRVVHDPRSEFNVRAFRSLEIV